MRLLCSLFNEAFPDVESVLAVADIFDAVGMLLEVLAVAMLA
jgi:hypothetical protein